MHILSDDRRAALPPGMRGCRLISAVSSSGGSRVGVLHDPRGGSLVAVFRVRSPALNLLSPEERHRRVQAWGGMLAALASEARPVHRVQWIERSLPCGLGEFRFEPAADAPKDAVESYERLLADEVADAMRHEVLVAVAARAVPSRRVARMREALDTLLARLRLIEAELLRADLGTEGALSATALGECLRQGFASTSSLRVTSAGGARGGGGSVWPWPISWEESWRHYRAEGTFHATYWVAQWPRVDVGPDFLAPVLAGAGHRRALSVVMQPIPGVKALRLTEHARTSQLADEELRRQTGFFPTAKERRQKEQIARRETELADGHSQYRFSGYVGVVAESTLKLEEECSELEQAAALSRLELRRMHGETSSSFCFTIPMARGLD